MKQISASLASKLKQDSVVERDYIIFSGETTRHYIWFNLYDDCYNNGNFIGTFVMKRIELTYNDSDLEFKNKEFNAYKEYKLDDGTWEAINYGTFVVTDIEESDTKEEITVTAYDYTLKFANTYKTDLDYASGKITLFQVLQEVCQKVGVELENTSIDNGNFIVDSNQFGENALYGNVITAIAQMSCDFAKITPENKLKLLFKNESNITIETKDYEEFEDKRDTLPYNAVSLGMSNVEGENVSLVAQGVDPDEAKYLTINDNPFAYTQDKRTQLIQAIFDKINGFGYSSFVLSNCLYPQLECGDLIKIRNKDGQLVDSIVLRPTFEETVLNFEAPSTIISSVSYVQPVDAIDIAKRTEIIVNKQEQTIQAVVSEVGQYDERIANVEQSVEGLTTQVSEIANLIRETSGNNILIIEDASANDLKSLSIKGQISLLFGSDGLQYGKPVFFNDNLTFSDDLHFSSAVPYNSQPLYPNSELFGKNVNLIVEGTEETQTIKLPFTFLNYINNEVCDEFLLQDGKAKVIRRVGINSNLEKYELEQEVIEDLGELNITLFDSYNKIYLQCFDNAILNASYMAKNEYTDEFATKVELNSSLKQTSSSIIAEVNGTIDNVDKDLNAKLELKVDTKNLISEINASADVINLQSNRFSMTSDYSSINQDGTVNFKGGKISGFSFGENEFSSEVSSSYNYTQNDLDKLQQCILGTYSPTYEEKLYLDVNGDGILDALDMLIMRNMILGTSPTTIKGTFKINTDESQRCLTILDENNQIASSFGIYGIYSDAIHANHTISSRNIRTGEIQCSKLLCSGEKDRVVTTENYGKRLLNAYETATPYFGDIGSNITDENGYCKIIIEDIFKETIELDDYKVFIQECGDGKLYVKKYKDYFEVIGPPNLEFDWEIKAIQKGYRDIRLKEAIIKEINNEEVINN